MEYGNLSSTLQVSRPLFKDSRPHLTSHAKAEFQVFGTPFAYATNGVNGNLLALTSMNGYLAMRAHVTPIPTPPIVRVGASALTALAVAILTTGLTPGWRLLISVVSLIGALVLTLAHPYRRRLAEYAKKKNVSRVPRIGQVMPLFIVWLVLMLAPLLAPAAWWVTVLLGLAVFGWMMLSFPHFDGSRVLAYA